MHYGEPGWLLRVPHRPWGDRDSWRVEEGTNGPRVAVWLLADLSSSKDPDRLVMSLKSPNLETELVDSAAAQSRWTR